MVARLIAVFTWIAGWRSLFDYPLALASRVVELDSWRSLSSSARRVWFRLASGYPYAEVFAQIYANLPKIPLRC